MFINTELHNITEEIGNEGSDYEQDNDRTSSSRAQKVTVPIP